MSIIVDKLLEEIFDQGKETALGKIKQKFDDGQLNGRIKATAVRYFDDNFKNLPCDEAFDFTALNQFVNAHLSDKVIPCFNADSAHNREYARRSFIQSAYSYAHAETQEQKNTAFSYLKTLLAVIENFFLERIDEKDMFLANRTVDEITGILKDYIQKNSEKVIDAVNYAHSFAEFIDEIVPAPDREQSFHYRNEILRFQGRKEEISVLDNFLETPALLQWMAIVGEGGVGKSKLLYHYFKERQSLQNWKMVWFNADQLNTAKDFTKWSYPYNLLIVIDYTGAVAEELGKWFKALELKSSKGRPPKMRFVLLERMGRLEDAGHRKVDPFWYQRLKGDAEQAACVQRLFHPVTKEQPFLVLKGLSETELYEIIEDYTRANAFNISQEKEKIIEKAREIERDEKFLRPLIVLLVTEAVIEGREYKEKTISELIGNIIEKHKKTWLESICKNDKEMYNAVQTLLVYATAVNGWELNKLGGPFELASRVLLKKERRDITRIICELNTKDQFDGKLSPIEPDLIGEYFVLSYWRERVDYDPDFKEMIHQLWEKATEFGAFLFRCVDNYARDPYFHNFCANQMLKLMPGDTESDALGIFSTIVMAELTAQDIEETIRTVKQLRECVIQHPRSEKIQEIYASSLLNLMGIQEWTSCAGTINELGELAEQYPQNIEVQKIYARGLMGLAHVQELGDRIETIERLREEVEQYPQNEYMQQTYGYGLLTLAAVEEVEAWEETVERIKELVKRYSQNSVIQMLYARSLDALAAMQEAEDRVETIERLRKEAERYPQNDTVQYIYASSLANLAAVQEAENRIEMIEKLRGLAEQYPEDKDISQIYASSLENLATVQEVKVRTKTVQRIGELAERYPKNERIQEIYASSLADLAKVEKVEARAEIAKQIKALAVHYFQNSEIKSHYAYNLADLATVEEVRARAETIERIRELVEQQPQNEKIQELYAHGLTGLAAVQGVEDRAEVVEQIRKLAEQYSQNQRIQEIYAYSLTGLVAAQGAKARPEVVERMRKLAELHPKSEKISKFYAHSLAWLVVGQGEKARVETKEQIKVLAEQYPQNEAIQIFYAHSLTGLAAVQGKKSRTKTVELMKELAEQHPQNLFIEVFYLYGFHPLIVIEAMEDYAEISEWVTKLSKQYSQNERIQEIYAYSLADLAKVASRAARTGVIERIGELAKLYSQNERIQEIYASSLAAWSIKEQVKI